MKYYRVMCAPAVAAGLFLCSCAGLQPSLKPNGPEDTPQKAAADGIKLLDAGRAADSLALFQRATGLAPAYQPGHLGAALAYTATGDFKQAAKALKTARRRGGYTFDYYVACGRYNTALGNINTAIRLFDSALELNPAGADALYWKGKAYEAAGNPKAAAGQYKKALEADKNHAPAAEAWRALQDKERALAGRPGIESVIAASSAVVRGDLAYLIFASGGPGFLLGNTTAELPAVPDAGNDERTVGIKKAAALDLLELLPDGNFHPERYISRAEFALMAQALLAKGGLLDGGPGKFYDSAAPFADVPETHYAFSAVMIASYRGVLTGYPDGSYKPDEPITGAQAVNGLRMLAALLKSK